MDKTQKLTIELLEGFKQEVYIGPKNRIADSYFVSFETNKNELLFCLINKDLTPITPCTNKKLISFFFTEDKKNICLELKGQNDSFSNFYHFQKIGNHYKTVFTTKNKQQIPFIINQTMYQEYWFIEDSKGRLSLYHPDTTTQLTPFFDAIHFTEDDSIHLAEFESNITVSDIDNDENYEVYASCLVGFIDHQGRFSSKIYDTEKNIYQTDSQRFYTITGDNYKNDFVNLQKTLTKRYQSYYNAKEEEITRIIENLYLTGLPKEQKTSSHQKTKAKIIEFRKKEETI